MWAFGLGPACLGRTNPGYPEGIWPGIGGGQAGYLVRRGPEEDEGGEHRGRRQEGSAARAGEAAVGQVETGRWYRQGRLRATTPVG